jgi:hypothetical protein
MKVIRRSKLIAAQELNVYLINNRPWFMDNDSDVVDEHELEVIRDFSESIIEIRENGGLYVNPELSQQELQQTLDYVEFLEKEEYEKLVEYKIIEDIE